MTTQLQERIAEIVERWYLASEIDSSSISFIRSGLSEFATDPVLRAEIIAEYVERLPADWCENSSLETWFPMTAKELEDIDALLFSGPLPYNPDRALAIGSRLKLMRQTIAKLREESSTLEADNGSLHGKIGRFANEMFGVSDNLPTNATFDAMRLCIEKLKAQKLDSSCDEENTERELANVRRTICSLQSQVEHQAHLAYEANEIITALRSELLALQAQVARLQTALRMWYMQGSSELVSSALSSSPDLGLRDRVVKALTQAVESAKARCGWIQEGSPVDQWGKLLTDLGATNPEQTSAQLSQEGDGKLTRKPEYGPDFLHGCPPGTSE